MAFGTARRLKADVAEGVALVFGRLGIRRAGQRRVGRRSAPRTPSVLPPRGSKPGIGRTATPARRGRCARRSARPRRARGALRRVGRLARQPGLVVVISDFRDQQAWERPLGSLRVRHSVLAIEIVDPRESELPRVGHLALVDPESGERIEVDTSRRRVRERFAALERERRATVQRELRRAADRPGRPVDRRGLAARAWDASCDELRRTNRGWRRWR